MPILNAYLKNGFTEEFPYTPEFYQPPAWRWIREEKRGQNSKGYVEIPDVDRGF